MDPNKTIQEAKDYLSQNYKEGVQCPCCNQHVQLYKRVFSSIMARTLIRLYVLTEDKKLIFHHVKDIVHGISETGTNDFSKLQYWGLIEEKPKEEENHKTKTSGYWRITDRGRDFIKHKFRLPKYAYVYNGECRGLSKTETTDLREALTKHFNYEELMGKYAPKDVITYA